MTKQVGETATDKARLADLPTDSAARAKAMAHAVSNPATTHGLIGSGLLRAIAGGDLDQGELSLALHGQLREVRKRKLGSVSDALAAQAFSLDAMFIEMSRRAMLNLGEYPDAVERYMRLALKAQAQSRAMLEALAKLHQPREQTVRHIHVDNRGGQAVIAETVNTGGQENGKGDGQSHAAGAGAIRASAALPRPNRVGWDVSVAGDQGKEAMPDARRHNSRRAQG